MAYRLSHRWIRSSTVFFEVPYFSRDRRMIVSRFPNRLATGGRLVAKKVPVVDPRLSSFAQIS
jgi:hypothetical protein